MHLNMKYISFCCRLYDFDGRFKTRAYACSWAQVAHPEQVARCVRTAPRRQPLERGGSGHLDVCGVADLGGGQGHGGALLRALPHADPGTHQGPLDTLLLDGTSVGRRERDIAQSMTSMGLSNDSLCGPVQGNSLSHSLTVPLCFCTVLV